MTTSTNKKTRAVFAPDDYPVIRKALEVYAYNYGQSLPEEEMRKLSNLIHRIQRINYDRT